MSEPLIAARAATKRFGALQVLDSVDFAVHEGEAVGIVGPNGAGKTTLLACLSGSLPLSGGAICFRGKDVSAFNAAQRCRMGLARSHQVPRPFVGMTVFENVLAAAVHGGRITGNEAYDRSVGAISLCGMLPVANRHAATLGLLDRKRLELTRALATGPAVLLLDEIGGGLTDGETSELVDTIRSLREQKITIVWIEHIVHVLVQVAERLVCMDAGRIIADGAPQEVLADEQVVTAYLGGIA